jgi:NTE family protein
MHVCSGRARYENNETGSSLRTHCAGAAGGGALGAYQAGVQKLRSAAAGLLEQLPQYLKDSPEARLLGTVADRKVFNIVQLVYRARNYEGHSKDYEFSRASMEEHWRAGYHDARRTLRHPEVLERPRNLEGLFTFDLAQDSRE